MRTDIHAELSTFIIITSISEISMTWFPPPHTHRIGALWMIGSRVQIDSCRDLVIFSCRVGCFDSSVELWRSDRCSNEAKVGVRAPGEHIPKMYLKSNTKMSALVSQNTNRHSSEFKFIVCIMILIANVGAEWSEDESILNLLYFSDFCIWPVLFKHMKVLVFSLKLDLGERRYSQWGRVDCIKREKVELQVETVSTGV